MATRGKRPSRKSVKKTVKRKAKKPAKKAAPKKPAAPRVRDFKAEYERRIKRALEKGKTKQQGRGHKPKEHIVRKEREAEEYGASTSQIRSMKSFLARFNPVNYKDMPTLDDLIEFVRENGYEQFQTYRKVWDAARRKYLREQADGTYASGGIQYLNHLTGLAGAPESPWLYYH